MEVYHWNLTLKTINLKVAIGSCLRQLERSEGMLIGRDDYKSGYALYAFDISPSPCNIGEYKDPERRGNIGISIKFATAPTETLVLCAYLQFDGRIDISEAKTVTVNYKP